MALLLAVFNHQHRQPSDSAAPFIDLFASVGVVATDLGEPGAIQSFAVGLDQGTERAGFYFHA